MKHEFEILRLIESKKEGDYWDFKLEPHDNNASLLHDILCLSNSLYSGNKYLIYGVNDPDEGAEIIGLTEGQSNRKSQVQFIDFLRTKPFAGHSRPEVELHTLKLKGEVIDVLEIYDTPSKPYYLTEDYRCMDKVVKANAIYTRTNDTNTPIDKSADIGIIEKMWRQRFGIDLFPLDRMKKLLVQPHNWFKDIGNKSYSYHKNFPEFRIEFSEVREFTEVFSYFFTNENSFLGIATFKYHSTTLFELEYIFCDEMRIELAMPNIEHVKLTDYENWFYYYSLEQLNGMFLQFITDNLKHLKSRSSGFPFVIFNTDREKNNFLNFIKSNEQEINIIKPSVIAEQAKDLMEKQNKNPVIDPLFVDKITQLHKKWAGHNRVDGREL